MTLSGMGPSMVVEGGTNGAVFEGYLREVLVPALRQGEVIVMDNLSVHKSERVRELIEGAGAQLIYLPPYWPDFNPIEEAFSKIKNLIRKAGGRACTKSLPWRSVRRSARSAGRTRRHSSNIAVTVRRFNYYDRRCRYEVNNTSHATLTIHGGNTATFANHYNVIGAGQVPDPMLYGLEHFTLTPGGMSDHFDNFRYECMG